MRNILHIYKKLTVCAVLAALLLMPVTSYAAEKEEASVSLTVSVDSPCKIELLENGSIVETRDAKDVETFTWSYEEPEEHLYLIRQEIPKEAGSIKYDETVYEVRTYAAYGTDGKLVASVVVNEEGSKEKSSKIEFHNTPSEKPGEKDPYAPQNPKHSKTGYKDQRKQMKTYRPVIRWNTGCGRSCLFFAHPCWGSRSEKRSVDRNHRWCAKYT